MPRVLFNHIVPNEFFRLTLAGEIENVWNAKTQIYSSFSLQSNVLRYTEKINGVLINFNENHTNRV